MAGSDVKPGLVDLPPQIAGYARCYRAWQVEPNAHTYQLNGSGSRHAGGNRLMGLWPAQASGAINWSLGKYVR